LIAASTVVAVHHAGDGTKAFGDVILVEDQPLALKAGRRIETLYLDRFQRRGEDVFQVYFYLSR
jgi:hypothetical protein